MDKLFYIVTGNRFGQILIFTSRETAEEWAKKATRWTPEKIAHNIKEAWKDARGFYSIFPTK